jgi:carboxylate-amine ligase
VHPFASAVGEMSQGDHYEQLVADYAWAAVRGMSFGFHVHVAADDPDRTLAVYNAIRPYLPEIAALAGNAPFFDGEDTGLASVRPKLAEHFPRQGVPPVIDSWEAYADFLRWGKRGGVITDAKHLWWEARLNPLHGTIEVRAPDTQLRVNDAAGVTAFVQALVAWLGTRYDEGERWPAIPEVRIAENRWRALRYGLEGALVDFVTGEPVPTRERIAATIEQIRPCARQLGAEIELQHADELLQANGAERQRAVASEHGLRGLVAWMAEQF